MSVSEDELTLLPCLETPKANRKARLAEKQPKELVYSLNATLRNCGSKKNQSFQYNPPRYNSQLLDRFIPQRDINSLNVSQFNFMRPSVDVWNEGENLDVQNQIKMLDISWRKRITTRVLEQSEIFPSTANHRVLNFSHKSSVLKPINRQSISINIENPAADNIWKVKPRNKPLIGCCEEAIQLPCKPQHTPEPGTIDWGYQNLIVTANGQNLHFFSGMEMQKGRRSDVKIESSKGNSKSGNIRRVKWNHAGNLVALYSPMLSLSVYDTNAEKILWSEPCLCRKDCHILCICWSNDDHLIITGCTNGIMCIYHVCKIYHELLDSVEAHHEAIVTMALSPNNHYLASSGMDCKVRVFEFPELSVCFEVLFFDTIEALAWHPWEAGLLCIGGCVGDASLSFWDIAKHSEIGHKYVEFLSHVRHLAWNELSAELIVAWYYYEGEERFVTIPVLADWNRIVDNVFLTEKKQESEINVENIVWSPNHQVIGVQADHYLYCWNIFGGSGNDWEMNKEGTMRKKKFGEQTSVFNLGYIR